MKHFILVLLALCLLLFTSCESNVKTKEDIYKELKNTINDIDTYKCKVRINVKGTKVDKKYLVEHIFKKPNLFMIEIIEPADSKGCKTIYDGKKLKYYHPQIDQSYMLDRDKRRLSDHFFMGYFLNSIMNSDISQISKEVLRDDVYIVIKKETKSKQGTKTEKLWVNIKDYKPYKFLIKYDGALKQTIEMLYTNFEYNCKIQEIFK
ncbi:hypothetical protein PV797_17325 [Clostridiaceae bacterium M8S5]|nr:hypothetical protein PV797_17325 [Clostridiaceae bacterium M8S5]